MLAVYTHVCPLLEFSRCCNFFLALRAFNEHTTIIVIEIHDNITKPPTAMSMMNKRSKFEDPGSEVVVVIILSVGEGSKLEIPGGSSLRVPVGY